MRQELEDLWATRKLRLELCLRLRVFERDALEASGQLEMWAQELQGPPREGSPEQLLRVHNDGVAHMQNTAFQVLQQGQELAQVSIDRTEYSQEMEILNALNVGLNCS